MNDMTTPRSYVIRSIKPGVVWQNGYGEFQSYSMSLEGFGEPVSMSKSLPINKEPLVGDELYGHIEERQGDVVSRIYYEFKSDPRPTVKIVHEDVIEETVEAAEKPVADSQPSYGRADVKWAMRMAMDLYIGQGCPENDIGNDNDPIETMAAEYLKIMDKLQGDE